MQRGAYVLAVLGESPAVLSELLWWLCVREQRPVAGIEVWATGRGGERLRKLVDSPAWSELSAQTGPLPMLQPVDTPPQASHGFRVHPLLCGDRVLHDVRSQEESAAVAARLHDRVRSIRADLPDHIDLVASLAGGRKTVSAALQTALCLQAGPTDRLVHVLLHAELEAALRREGQLTSFCAPGPRWQALSHVPVDDQVLVYDVLFPRIRQLVPRRLAQALAELPWDKVWPVLDANTGRSAHARLVREARELWRFVIVDATTDRVLYDQQLRGRPGAMLAAMALAPSDSTAAGLAGWLDEHEAEVGWVPPTTTGNDDLTRQRAVRSAASTLRSLLADLPIGLEHLGPPAQGFSAPHVQVDLEGDTGMRFRGS